MKDLTSGCHVCGYDNIPNSEKYPLALREGSVLEGRYIVGRVLGQGGFGITYIALDHQLKIKVAIKEYLPDGMATRLPDVTAVSVYTGEKSEHFAYGAERFLDEARTLAKFNGNHNIVAVKSYFKENNTAYFVMDYIEGISFKNYIKNKGGKIEYQDALRILLPVMDALSTVHKEGFIHRDVTPDNIYITKDEVVKLLDFGSAKYSLGDKSKSLDVILKAGYAPKEQYMRRSRQGPYTDIYSLAACFYASITGFLPPEALERMENDELIPIVNRGIKIPNVLDDAINKGLEVRAEDRFQSIEEFREAIYDILNINTTLTSDLTSTVTSPETISNTNHQFVVSQISEESQLELSKAPVTENTYEQQSRTESKVSIKPLGFLKKMKRKQIIITSFAVLVVLAIGIPIIIGITNSNLKSINATNDSLNTLTSSQTNQPKTESTKPSNFGQTYDPIQITTSEPTQTLTSVPLTTSKPNPTSKSNPTSKPNPTSSATQTSRPSNTSSTSSTTTSTPTPTPKPTPTPTPTPKPTPTSIPKVSNIRTRYTLITSLYTADVTYDGEWQNNLPNGNGKATFLQSVPGRFEINDTLSGKWVNGLLEGYGVYASGNFELRGNFVHGLKEGTVKAYIDGVYQNDIEFKNGSPVN